MLPPGANPWATRLVQEMDGDPAADPETTANRLLINLLKSNDFFVPVQTLSAIELIKGNPPIDLPTATQELDRQALLALDKIVSEGGLQGFDLEAVSQIEQFATQPRVKQHAANIRHVDSLRQPIAAALDNPELASSIVRLLAARPSQQLEHQDTELGLESSKIPDQSSLTKIKQSLSKAMVEIPWHVESFLQRITLGDHTVFLPRLTAASTTQTPTLGDRPLSLSQILGVLFFFVIGIPIIIAGSHLTENNGAPQKTLAKTQTFSQSPLDSFPNTERLSQIAALEVFVSDASRTLKLIDVIAKLESGLFSYDEQAFQESREYLRKAHIDQACILDYESQRKLLTAMRKNDRSNAGPFLFAGERKAKENFAVWFDELRISGNPKGNLLGPNDDNITASKRLLRLKESLLKEFGEELEQMKKTIEVLRRYSGKPK